MYPWDSTHHRPTPELPKTHQDLSTTDDTSPEHTYLNSTQGTAHGSDAESTERTAHTEDGAPQPQQLKDPSYDECTFVQRKAGEDAKASHTNITRAYNELEQEVLRHVPYSTAEDDVVTNGMRDRKHWKDQMSNVFKDLNNLVALINGHNIAHTEVDIDALRAKINNL